MLPSQKKVAILGRDSQTQNYKKALDFFQIPHEVTLSVGKLSEFDALLLPGGGDIDPLLLNVPNEGSKNIDTELDVLQFQALDLFVRNKKPVLGICKGFQLINLYFGGKLIQDLPQPSIHTVQKNGDDAYHEVHTHPQARLHPLCSEISPLFPNTFDVNSAHHQAISKCGKGLQVLHTAKDGIPEGVLHETLPLLAFQWHPERMLFSKEKMHRMSGLLAFHFFRYFLLAFLCFL